MKRLNELPMGSIGKIVSIEGDRRFMSRITSIGLTIGNKLEVMRNEKNQPVLVYGRDTLVAVNQRESNYILLEEISKWVNVL